MISYILATHSLIACHLAVQAKPPIVTCLNISFEAKSNFPSFVRILLLPAFDFVGFINPARPE
jgi:hypothetical protein